jgi:hypothetical protein
LPGNAYQPTHADAGPVDATAATTLWPVSGGACATGSHESRAKSNSWFALVCVAVGRVPHSTNPSGVDPIAFQDPPGGGAGSVRLFSFDG